MSIFRQIAALLLTAVVVISTTGVTVHKHYCMGELKDVKLYAVAESCGDKMGFSPEMMKKMTSVGCCENTVEEFKVDDLQKAQADISMEANQQLLAVIAYVILDLDLLEKNSANQAYLNYKPPLIDQDIPLLTQSFLI